MGLQLRLLLLAGALLGLLAATGAAGWYGYRLGHTAGSAEVQGKWDKAQDAADEAAAAVRKTGFRAAELYQAKLTELEARYARTNVSLTKALSRKLVCPASGRIGDVVLPAALVDSMFNLDDRQGDPAPRPAGSKPAR